MRVTDRWVRCRTAWTQRTWKTRDTCRLISRRTRNCPACRSTRHYRTRPGSTLPICFTGVRHSRSPAACSWVAATSSTPQHFTCRKYRHQTMNNSSVFTGKPGLAGAPSAFFLHLFQKRIWQWFLRPWCPFWHSTNSAKAVKQTQSTDPQLMALSHLFVRHRTPGGRGVAALTLAFGRH